MQITIKKNMVTRMAAVIMAAFIAAIMFAFTSINFKAGAADETVTADMFTTENDETPETFYVDGVEFTAAPNTFELTADPAPMPDFEVVQLGAGGGAPAGGAGAASGSAQADTAYSNVINFFITWIRRIGAMVALVGAVMFALAIKNNDAEQKQAGLLTMVAGFVVFAICLAADMFDLFT